ncbi:MAG: DNA replication and repair protein RecF [Moraxellaceae bacterium]|nr:DNA replication and repair protein RecF [Pseudobdellovibrionaceae bacterium]
MKIDSLYLKDFRNIEELVVNFSPRLNIFIGNNGQGKTNVLEAIYLLLEKESFRFGNNSIFIKNESSVAYLSCRIQNKDKDYKIQLSLEPNKKKYLINEKTNSQFEKDLPSIILFSPESLNIIKESSDQRRQLIDSVVKSVYKHNQTLILDFKRTLKTRNRLLSDMAEKKIDYQVGIDTLTSLNEIFLKLSTDLTCVRLDALKTLKPMVSEVMTKIENKVTLAFDYHYVISDQNCENESYENIYKIMQKRMAELLPAEVSFGASLIGPQKHDVIFLYNGKDSRFFCSQGQQRTIILAFKMAQIVYHQQVNESYPILLLDDVLSELDQTKQESLIKYLNEIETQTFLTTTDVESLTKLNIDRQFKFNVQDGKIV